MAKQRSKNTGSLFKRIPTGPWVAAWYDHTGKRRVRSTKTTDKATAERIVRQWIADAALRREGIIDPALDRFALEGRRPLSQHIEAYITHCRHAGQSAHHIIQKRRHLERLASGVRVERLVDLTVDALERHLAGMKDQGLSARSINFARQIILAFASWCQRTGRLQANVLKVVPKQDEGRDRRHVRRPLTEEELGRLIEVARHRGRGCWYLCAALAGLRKGDMKNLLWKDIDFRQNTITIACGKAHRTDVLPMHPQLADALRKRQVAALALPTAKVFPQVVTDATRLRDFLRAGLARRVPIPNATEKFVQYKYRRRRRPTTKIVTEDAEGRVIDLHALRTTLGTQLARAGVAPQIAQRIMRHSDYRTTLKHYTVLGLADTSAAVARLPSIQAPQAKDSSHIASKAV